MKKVWIVLIVIVIGLSACAQDNLLYVTPTVTGDGIVPGTIEAKLTPPLPSATNTNNPLNATPTPSNGIVGSVSIGPTCPGPVQMGDSGCQDRPYQARITILDNDQSEILTILTDENGFFQIPLIPGEYILRPESGKPLPIASEQVVVVVKGQFTHVTILYDSGIR